MSEEHFTEDEQPRHRLTDEHKLAMAEGRERARLERQRKKEEERARGIDYEDIVPMSAEERSERRPNVAEIAASAASAAANAPGGGNTAEIAAAVAAAVAQVMLAQQPAASSTGPRPIAPAILKRREEARVKMEELLDEVQRTDQWPLYELLTDFYYGEQLHEATITRKGPYGASETRTRIRFQETPNEGMRPKDDLARRIYGLFIESIGGLTPDLGDAVHDAVRGRPRHAVYDTDEIAAPRLMGKAVEPSSVRLRVMTDTPEEEVTYVGPPRILGTVQAEVPGLY